MNYTKGEWKAAIPEGSNGYWLVASNGKEICTIYESVAEIEANAHLIAAAPALYEALKALKEWKLANPDIGNRPGLPVGLTGNEIKLMVDKALSKAEGK